MPNQIDNPTQTVWKWIKQYKVIPKADPITTQNALKAYIRDKTPGAGLAWWLSQFDNRVKAEFWLSTFEQAAGSPIVTLIILLVSDGDPWEGDASRGIPPIPGIGTFFEVDKGGHYYFEMDQLTTLP